MTGLTIGIDIGTSSTKAVLLDPHTGIVAVAARSNSLYSPAPGHAEADPLEWLTNTRDLIRELIAPPGLAPRVTAIATTGMVPAVVQLDVDGNPRGRAILQSDARAHREVGAVRDELAAIDTVRLTGSAVSQQWVGPTLRWLRTHDPDWQATTTVLGSYDWLLVALGARRHVELNWAIESGLHDLSGRADERLFAAAGIESHVIPEVARPGDLVGSISPALADELGLRRDVALVVGGADHVLSAYAAGVDTAGDWLVKLGSAGDILVGTDDATTDERYYLDAHPSSDLWLANGCMATSGSMVTWLARIMGNADLGDLEKAGMGREGSGLLMLPHLLGEKSPVHDPYRRGVIAGLHLGTDRVDLYLAALEAVAFGVRRHLEVFRDRSIPLRRGHITNGGSASQLWKRIHADILNTPLLPVLNHPGASLGAAVAAGIGSNLLAEWCAVARYVHLGEPVMPDAKRSAIYGEAYARWLELDDGTLDVVRFLAHSSRGC